VSPQLIQSETTYMESFSIHILLESFSIHILLQLLFLTHSVKILVFQLVMGDPLLQLI